MRKNNDSQQSGAPNPNPDQQQINVQNPNPTQQKKHPTTNQNPPLQTNPYLQLIQKQPNPQTRAQRLSELLAPFFRHYPLYSQAETPDPLVPVTLGDPLGSGVWHLVEYDPQDNLAFGLVTGLGFDELGNIDIREVEELGHPLMPWLSRIVMTVHDPPKLLSVVQEEFRNRASCKVDQRRSS